VARAFDLYLQCRTTEMVVVKVTKERGKKEEVRMAARVTGYHHLPRAGGLLDQPCWTMDMFAQFERGENSVALNELTK
jgi:hypothetical protein